jgi:hypothetical protein
VVDKLEHKLGIKGSPTGVIRLDEVRVPDTHRLGEVGEGFKVAMHTLDRSRPTIGAQAVGIAQGALDYAVDYMRERRTFGADRRQPGPAVDGRRRAMKIEAARNLVYKACAMVDEGDPHGELSMAGAMAKCFASDVAMEVTTDAVQFLGGYGYTNEFPVERMMRDAKITQIYEGTNQIQRIVIAKHLMPPGVWEVRVFVGNDDRGRPKQVSRTVRGSKRDAQRLAAELTVVPPSPSSGRTVADVLERLARRPTRRRGRRPPCATRRAAPRW